MKRFFTMMALATCAQFASADGMQSLEGFMKSAKKLKKSERRFRILKKRSSRSWNGFAMKLKKNTRIIWFRLKKRKLN